MTWGYNDDSAAFAAEWYWRATLSMSIGTALWAIDAIRRGIMVPQTKPTFRERLNGDVEELVDGWACLNEGKAQVEN